MKKPYIFGQILIVLVAVSCSRRPPSPSHSGVEIERAPDLIAAPYNVEGYQVVVQEPMKAMLTIERTGEEPVVLEWKYSPGEEAVFGYWCTSFKTRAGQAEHKCRTVLQFIRRDETRTRGSHGGTYRDFFLDDSVTQQSRRREKHLPFDETLTFASMTCGRDGKKIDLSIRFEKLSNAKGNATHQ